MSDQPIAPLPPEIDMLLSLERDAYGEEPALKSAVLSHVELSVALRGPSGGGSAPPGGSGAGTAGGAKSVLGPGGKALGALGTGAFVVGVLVGGLGGRASRPSAVTPASVALATSVDAAPESLPASIPESSGASREIVSTPKAAPSAEVRARPADVTQGGNDLVREREVIDAARAALARGRPADALSATTRHAERWPRGHLAEEREVIAIQALAGLGRRVEADRRATAFKRAFPSSMLIPAVDAALAGP